MELLEYSRVIRERIWVVILCVGLCVGLVLVYLARPVTRFEAGGTLRANEGANRFLLLVGSTVQLSQSQTFWPTLEQVGGSRELLRAAAEQVGIAAPQIPSLAPFQARRLAQSNILSLSATAGSADTATKLTDAGVQMLIRYWREARTAATQEVGKTLAEQLKIADREVVAAQASADNLARSPATGGPGQNLASVQQELTALHTQLASASVDLQVAQDRLVGASRPVASEASARREGRAAGAVVGPEAASLRSQGAALKLQLATLLQTKTQAHPEVKAVQAELAALEAEISKLSVGGATTNEQLLAAQLDAAGARGRVSGLEAQVARLEARLPILREQSNAYDEANARLQRLEARRDSLLVEEAKVDDELERLRTNADIVPLDKAEVLPRPRSMRKTVGMFLLAIFLGVGLGMLFALTLRYVDATVKGETDAAQMLGRNVLAVIPRFEELPAGEPGDDRAPPEHGADPGQTP